MAGVEALPDPDAPSAAPPRRVGPPAWAARSTIGTPLAVFRPRGFDGGGWPSLPLPGGAQVWAAYLELDRTQWLAPTQLEAGQMAQLRSLLRHGAEQVPYIRTLLARLEAAPDDFRTLADLRRLPVLPRRRVQEESASLTAAAMPEGTRDLGPIHTSGTSGVPIAVLQTNVAQTWWLAFHLRDLAWGGVDPRGTLAMIRPTRQPGPIRERLLDGVALPTWGPLHAVIETGRSHVMNLNQEPRRQLEWLLGIDPDYILSHPSNLQFLAGLALEQGRRFGRLRRVLAISEQLPDDVRDRIAAGFGAPVNNTYSCNEAGYLASPCPDAPLWHVHAENVILEVLDAADRPCPPGATGRVLLTTLHNTLMPLVRYEIMDEAEVGPARCPCGRGLPTLTRIHGKRHLMLRLPDGRARSSSDLVDGLRNIGGAHQFQVVQRAPDDVLVRIVPDRSWSPAHADRIVALARAHLEAPVRVEVALLDRLPVPPGGKILDVLAEPA